MGSLMVAARKGRVTVDDQGHEVQYWLHGSGPETLVCLHGGPGMDHRYMEPLSKIAGDGVQVLLYDQLGSGESDRPDDDSLWVVPRFVEELEAIRQELGLGNVHILGHSWGGCLALEYTLAYPEYVESLMPSNIGPDIAEVVRGMEERKAELPTETYRTLTELAAKREFSHPEMETAAAEYYCRFTRRAIPFDPDRSVKELEAVLYPVIDDIGPAYGAMWGPFEFVCTGSLINWDVTNRLGEIKVPTLVLSGHYDEVKPTCARALAEGIAGANFVIFGQSSHFVMLEGEAETYLATVRSFVDRVVETRLVS